MPTILITGASRGFGRELLNIYSKNRWTIFPLVRGLNSISDIISLYSSQCYPIVGNVTSTSIGFEIENVLQKTTNSLDVLINNAGIIRKKRGIMNTSPDDLKKQINL